MRNYGYNDPALVTLPAPKWTVKRWIVLALALIFLVSVWFALDQKLLFGEAWFSPTYDNEDWRTNEGDLHTFGMWDLEAHIWKTQFVLENFPHFQWNPYWYLGMPLLKYYQSGFYVAHAATMFVTGTSLAKSATLLIIFSHLLATLLTFLLCYKLSRRIWVAALSSVFVLSNTFISLRSYGWEPITVVFLFLYPLGLLAFFKEPLRPYRFWLIITMVAAYLSHPLLFFSLCMTMGLYLFSIAIRRHNDEIGAKRHYILEYFGMVLTSVLLGAVQFFPQVSYEQVTSGAHMGVKYLPFYQVPYNIITLKDFFFDAGNLKGPGPIIMIAFFLLIFFAITEYRFKFKLLRDNELICGLTFVLFMMIFFYYLERYNLFPMNLLRSIQYHRIIPEFIIAAAALVASLSNVMYTHKRKVVYYTMLIAFVAASGIVVHSVQAHWQTTDDISDKEEFIYDAIPGRISVPYTDQSLAVRNSFTEIPQVYGYYEQGITNAYNDEIFSVSSGFHNAQLTLLYLKAANVGRLYVNTEEGRRDQIVITRLRGSALFVNRSDSRYSYFEIPLKNPLFSQALDGDKVAAVQKFQPGCRELFKEVYCGSAGEEFVGTDPEEVKYLSEYVKLLEEPYHATSQMRLIHPDQYEIPVQNADSNTVVVVKMTHDKDFKATVEGKEFAIEPFGPDFMLISPNIEGDYTIHLKYYLSKPILVGGYVSVISFILLCLFFLFRKRIKATKWFHFQRGDMT